MEDALSDKSAEMVGPFDGKWADERARRMLRMVFDAAVARAQLSSTLARFLPERPLGRCIAVGAGKTAALMALAVEERGRTSRLAGLSSRVTVT